MSMSRLWNGRRRQPRWALELQVGDVLANRTGSPPRAVRSVSRWPGGELHSVTLAIRACSWTGRCTTIILYNDLRQRGYHKVPGHVSLRTKLDRRIKRCIDNIHDRSLTCCDVRGVS